MNKMNSRSILSAILLGIYGLAFTGCGGTTTSSAPATPASAQHDHDHDHDHDDHGGHEGHDHDGHDDSHAGHDHPAHGPNGGHMVELGGGAHAEWLHDDESDLLTVYPEDAAAVTKVEMKTTISGNETSYAFEKKEDDGKTTYQLVSPELLTSIKMGELVDTKLIITTDKGEAVGKVQHHAH